MQEYRHRNPVCKRAANGSQHIFKDPSFELKQDPALPGKQKQARFGFGFARFRLSSLRDHPIVTDNLSLVVLVAGYIAAIYAVHGLFGIENRIVLNFYYGWFARVAVVFSGLFILVHMRHKSYRRYLTARSLAGVAIIFLLAPLFKSAFASFKQTIPLIHPFSWDSALMRLDVVLHFGHHPWVLLKSILDYPLLVRTIDFFYVFWFVVLAVYCLWMAWTRRRRLRRCFFISTLLVWILLGSGLGTLFSSAGPCYFSYLNGATPNPYSPLMTRLTEIGQIKSLWALDNQQGLWDFYRDGTWYSFGGISAMPSIHLAMSMIFVMVSFNFGKWPGYFSILYLLIMQIGSVILGWHYAVDGYAGILLAGGIWFAVRRYTARNH
jgi:hypothetical protein